MKKNTTKPKGELSETINYILKNLPDPKNNNVSTIKDEVILNDKKVIYLAQKIKGTNGFCWNINLS